MIGCAEVPTAAPPAPIVPSVAPLAMLRGTVDLDRHTLTFSPVIPNGTAGFVAAIYGDQNVNVRLYNSAVVLDSSTAPWRWSASVGIRNMRPHYVGDEEAVATPLDTMGVYVFFVQDATPGQPCTGCFARIGNHDGTLSFNAPNQKFFHWRERLNPMSSPAGDTTQSRRVWQFETSPGVRSFSFVVLIAAAWPPPHETRWRIHYPADVLPGNAAPSWKTEAWSPGGSASVGSGVLSIRGNSGGLYMFYRRDPIAPAQNAYMSAAVTTASGGATRPEVALLLSDHVRLIALGISATRVGVMTNTGQFQSGTISALTSGTHTFQLRKYAADSIVWFVDGTRRGRATYSSLSPDTFTSTPGAHAAFGAVPTPGGNTSTWDDVIYEIGAASP
jgi:hypothetical protein